MKFKTITTFLLMIMVFSCTTLPVSEGENGLLLVPVSKENTTEIDSFMAHYDIYIMNNDKRLAISAGNKVIPVVMRAGTYTTEKVQSIPYDQVEKLAPPQKRIIEFEVVNGGITVFPVSFDIIQEDYQGKKGWITQYFNMRPLSNDEKNSIIDKFRDYKNFDTWKVIEY